MTFITVVLAVLSAAALARLSYLQWNNARRRRNELRMIARLEDYPLMPQQPIGK